MYAEVQFIEQSAPTYCPVSFIIPAHNEEKYIGKTIQAIHDAIEESDILAEIIVVNDDSSDDTVRIASELGARTIDVSLRNIGAVRNAGAKIASNEWIVFVDADTLIPGKTLIESLNCLASGCAGGGARVVIDETQQLFWAKRVMYLAVVLGWQIIGGWAAGCYMFCRKDLFDSFGGFDEEYFAGEELFFSRQLKRQGRFRLVRNPVVTSARKLHRYSTSQLVRFILVPLLNFRSMFRSRSGLEILYEDQR